MADLRATDPTVTLDWALKKNNVSFCLAVILVLFSSNEYIWFSLTPVFACTHQSPGYNHTD